MELVDAIDAIPPGVVNLVTGSGGEVGDAIVESPDVPVISFTGSSDTARHLRTHPVVVAASVRVNVEADSIGDLTSRTTLGLAKNHTGAAVNPIVQILRPVSPLAWLPIVTMVVSASITSDDPALPKSFVISAIVVMMCSLWPTLINTALGVSSIDRDLMNVGKVLQLGGKLEVHVGATLQGCVAGIGWCCGRLSAPMALDQRTIDSDGLDAFSVRRLADQFGCLA